MTSASYVKGILSIHTTEDPTSPRIDYDDIKNLTIHEVENYGATGTVQLVNNYPVQTENLLSNLCTLWSDGTPRKLDRAMFLRIYHDERTEESAIGVFLITQINATDGLITLTFCDSTQYLRSVGAEYVRNHLNGAASWHGDRTWQFKDNAIYVNKPTHAQITGNNDVMWGKKYSISYTREDSEIYAQKRSGSYLRMKYQVQDGSKAINKIILKNVSMEGYFKCTIYIDNQIQWSIGGQGEFVRITDQDYVINVYSSVNYLPGTNIELYMPFDDLEAIFHIQRGDAPNATIIGTEGSVTNTTLCMETYYLQRTTNITGTTPDVSHFKIETIDGSPITADEFTNVWNDNKRAMMFYPDYNEIEMGSIFASICRAAGFTSDAMTGTRPMYAFRCNGDCYHNYLLTLADMPKDDRQRAFRSSKIVWNHINTGLRHKKDDTSELSLIYGGLAPVVGAVPFMNFNPSISLKNHPRLAVAKGSSSSKVPIMVALFDPNVRLGATELSVNGSITTPVEGALATYSSVITNRSEDWQGEMEISGIHLDYFARGEYVGGIPIRITDDRYGFLDYEAKIKEIKWDFANQKTTITINNYSEMYSNAILDTSKMAYSAGDLSAEATNMDTFARQFILIDATDQVSSGSTDDVYCIVDSGTNGHITDATTIDLPELNLRVVNGYFAAGNGITTAQYGINAVKVGNLTHTITNVDTRPDKQANNSLIVNVIYRLT